MQTDDRSDALVENAMNGDSASLEALLRREQDWIFNLCRRLVSGAG